MKYESGDSPTDMECKDSNVAKRTENETGVELYLSEDILQGENIPFYLMWRGINVDSIEFRFEGFKSISRLYNVRNSKKAIAKELVLRDDLKTPGYLGGILTTKISDDPFREALLEITIKLSNGESIQLTEQRTLHTTRVQIASMPELIRLPFTQTEPGIEIDLKGSTTVLIDIMPLEGSEINLVLPREVLTALEKFAYAVTDGLKRLKDEFPAYAELIDSCLDVPSGISQRQYFDMVESKLQEVKYDRSFMEAIAIVLVSAILGQGDVKGTLFVPLMEYMESTVASKAFFESPFLCAKVPSSGGKLLFQLIVRDLLRNQCDEPAVIETFLQSDKEVLVPIKDIIQVRRLL